MVADDGTFSGTSEAVYILNTLKGQLKAPASSVPCQQLYTGTLLGQKVVVAISGEHRRTLPCVSERKEAVHYISFRDGFARLCLQYPGTPVLCLSRLNGTER